MMSLRLLLCAPLLLVALADPVHAAEKVTTHPALDYHAAPSRDGRFLAFVSERDGNEDIWLKSLAQGVFALPRRLTEHPGKDTAPALDRSGSRLLYVSYRTDPRGDIYLLDVLSGGETRLTDEKTGEGAPAWGSDEVVWYLREDSVAGTRGVVRHSLKDNRVDLLVDSARSFAVGANGWLVFSDGRRLLAVRDSAPAAPVELTDGRFLDLWPSFLDDSTILFTRYQDDTNHNGTLDTDDESSIYLGRWDLATGERLALYRITPGNEFHVYPAPAQGYVYYTDLRDGEVWRVKLSEFLEPYFDLGRARELAAIQMDRGDIEQALMTLGNISVNLVPQLPLPEQAVFDLALVELLRDAGRYALAKDVVARYAPASGSIGTMFKMVSTALQVEAQAREVSEVELKRIAQERARELVGLGSQAGADESVKAMAFLEAGRLHLLAGEPLTALEFLVRVDRVQDKEIRAKALFARAKVYRQLGEDTKILQVFLDVVGLFGEDSFWGRRAIAQAIAVAEQPDDFRRSIASLTALADQHRARPQLAASALLRAAELYRDRGEQLRAVETLERVITEFPAQTSLVADAYRKKGEVLAASQRYEEAAQAYAALAALTGRSGEEIKRTRRLMVLQLVRSALRKRESGEVRIAAKALRQLIDEHPDSVEAHRGYIETKVMLGEVAEVQRWYRTRSEAQPARPADRYGLGLALSYSTPPDLRRVIAHLEEAIRMDPAVSYFHQTLGWAYEQAERGGKSGALEQAEREYRIALELNDAFQFPEVESNLLLNLGNVYMSLGNFAEAYRHYARRLAQGTLGGESVTELLYRKSFGEACFKTGRTGESIQHYGRALALAPADKPELRAELLERIGLSHQDAGHHAKAVDAFAEALELNMTEGATRNLARLRRNIGVNLYNLSLAGREPPRDSLKRALKSYFASLGALERFGVQQRTKGQGLFQLEVALGLGGTQAAAGFDRRGEEKLMFSYIASAYERLAEPAAATEYLLKKLQMIPGDGSPTQAVAARTEEAVVLNRLGVLSHAMGRAAEATAYFERSLQRTRELGLSYGTRVNLYNLSRLAVERHLGGKAVEDRVVDTVVEGVEALLPDAEPDRLTVYLLANAGYLLAALDSATAAKATSVRDATVALYRVYRARQQALTYYRSALRLIEQGGALPADEARGARLVLKLNLLEFARAGGKPEAYDQLRGEIQQLVEARPTGEAWLHFLLEAESATTPETRASLLGQSLDALLTLPPQASPQPVSTGTLPFYEVLSSLYADVLVEKGEGARAFAVTERIAMRQVAIRLYEALGGEFFLAGLGEYAADLDAILRDLRQPLQGDRAGQLRDEFEALIFALYEEYPSAVSYFYQYEPAPHLVAEALGPSAAYVRVIRGRQRVHAWVHEGDRVRYASLDTTGDAGAAGPRRLALERASTVYIAAPPGLAELVERQAPPEAHVIRVSSVYDVLNAYHVRSLFASRAAVAGQLEIPVQPEGGGVTVDRLTGRASEDEAVLRDRHVFIAASGLKDTGFVVSRELGVHDTVSLRALVGQNRHTAILVNPGADPETIRLVLVPALIRAGFAHVVVNEGQVAQEVAGRFVSAYLARLADRRAIDAAAIASEIESDRTPPPRFRLYGFVGMDQAERAAFAAEAYQQAVADTVAEFRAEQYAAALRRAEDALSIIAFTSAGQDFRQLTEVAVDTAFRIGQYDTAVFHQKRLLAHLTDSGDTDALAEAWYRLGILYSRLEQFAPAIEHLETAIGMWRNREELDRLAEGIATLGVVKENMGAYSDALTAFGRSFDLYRELGEVEDMAAQHRRIGRIDYLRLGRFERARESFTAAMTAYKEVGNRRAEAETLFEIGLTYEKIGLFDEADRRHEAGRRIGHVLEDPYVLATGSLYLANTAWFRGQYQEAFQHLTDATREAERAQDPQLPIMIQNTKALVYWTLNDLDKAFVHVKQAVATAEREQIKTEIASSHNNLGIMLRERGDLEGSLTQFERARQIDEQVNSRWGLGYDHRNIGISLMRMNRDAEAESNFLLAERYSAEIKNVNNWVKALLELGNVNRKTGKPDAARDYYNRAYDVSKQYGIKEVLWRAAAGNGSVLRAGGKPQEAFTWYAEAVDVVEGLRAALKLEEFRNSFQANKQDLYRDIISLLVDLGRYDEAFNYLERSRARSFIDLLGNQKLELKTQAEQQAYDRVTDLAARVDSLSTELASFETPPEPLQERFREAKAAYEEAVLVLKQRNPQLSSFVAVDPLKQEQVERLLEPGVGLLSYKITEDRVFIWLVRSARTTFYASAADAQEIEALVKAYRERVQRLEPVNEELRRLYDILIRPVQADLVELEYLGIIPDGALHFLSFAALRAPDGYLVDRYPLFYSPSASALTYTFAKRSETKRTRVLAVGNPDLGNFNYELPLAELEARSIKWNFPELDILTGAKATKEWITRNISKYGIVHLATHGEFNALNPLFSSLWLASDRPDARKLTVREVFSLDIKADLVTLSACQTGLGKLEAGELIGLNRAFIYAGTHALVSALWRVDDLSTSVLMKHFYRSYVKMDKARSLRQAQLLVKKDFPHPAYWAGFALVGDYR